MIVMYEIPDHPRGAKSRLLYGVFDGGWQSLEVVPLPSGAETTIDMVSDVVEDPAGTVSFAAIITRDDNTPPGRVMLFERTNAKWSSEIVEIPTKRQHKQPYLASELLMNKGRTGALTILVMKADPNTHRSVGPLYLYQKQNTGWSEQQVAKGDSARTVMDGFHGKIVGDSAVVTWKSREAVIAYKGTLESSDWQHTTVDSGDVRINSQLVQHDEFGFVWVNFHWLFSSPTPVSGGTVRFIELPRDKPARLAILPVPFSRLHSALPGPNRTSFILIGSTHNGSVSKPVLTTHVIKVSLECSLP